MTQGFCLIWGLPHEATVRRYTDGERWVENSPRAGGSYIILEDGADIEVDRLDSREKARLTSWLIEQRRQSVEFPKIDRAIIDRVKARRNLSEGERTDRLLRYISDQTPVVGNEFSLNTISPQLLAWSESVEEGEIGFLIHDLMKKELLDARAMAANRTYGNFIVPKNVHLTVDGYDHIRQQIVNEGTSQAFVAIWLHDDMKVRYEKGIAPAIEDAGYKPMLISQKEHVNKIEDEIIGEIRRSRFVVADFTHDAKEGVRGSVYYEAGFAHGLGLDVIFVCHSDSFENVHFDTKHFNHIVYASPDDLRQGLTTRIRAVIGQGPLKSGD